MASQYFGLGTGGKLIMVIGATITGVWYTIYDLDGMRVPVQQPVTVWNTLG